MDRLIPVKSIPLAIRYMVLSALGFALMSACVKAAASRGIPILEIVAFRAAISLLLSYLDVRRKRISIWGTHRGLLVARGVFGVAALICVYYSVSTLALADATVLQYTYPAFTAILALLFLGESVQRATVVGIIISFLGVMVMTQEGSQLATQRLPLPSLFAALGGALGSAIAYVLVRRLSQSEDSAVIIFYFPLIALPTSLLLLGDSFVVPGGGTLLLLIMVGVFTQIGQIGLTKAMAVGKAGSVSVYGYIQVIFSTILGVIWFAEVPGGSTWLGGVLIIGGALINALWKPVKQAGR